MKLIIKFILGLILFVVAAAALVLVFPSTVLNTRTLSFAVRRYGGAYRPSWKSLSLRVHSPGLLTKRVVLEAADFCFDELNGAARGCFEALELDATIHLASPFAVRRIERLVARAKELRIDSTAAPAAQAKGKNKKASSSGDLVPAWAESTTLGAVDVKIGRAELASSSGTTTAGLTAAYGAKPGPLAADAWAVLKGTGAAPGKRYDASLALDSSSFRDGKLTRLDARARLKAGGGVSAEAFAKLEPEGERLKLSASAAAKAPGFGFNAKLAGEGGREGGKATFNAAVSSEKGKISRAALEGCSGEAAFSAKDFRLQKASLGCRVVLQPAPLGIGTGPKPKALTGILSVRGENHVRTARRDRFETRVSARLGPVKGYGGLLVALDADLAGPAGGSLAAERHVRVKSEISSFGELVRLLDGTEYAVPAPLNALNGTASAEASLDGRFDEEREDLEYAARTGLSSKSQTLDVAVKGKAVIPRPGRGARLRVETDVELRKIVLQLPYLELKAAPAPFADKRIKTGDPARDAAVDLKRAGAAAPPQAGAVDYDVTVRTSTPIILSTNLIKSLVPVSLDVRAKPEGLTGEIRVEGFNMEVFRQNATIDHITLTPGLKGAATALDGKIIYKKDDLTVNILLIGSTEKPVVTFESDPPLTQNEIVAFVLYGKSPNELDSDQKSSAGNAANAMTSGAFGLASLYLFASTPVDSVGYDPATQSYEVKFKLPGGATLSVGSNLQESSTLSLRKRLARHWELQTEAARGDRERGAITTFLQWFERY